MKLKLLKLLKSKFTPGVFTTLFLLWRWNSFNLKSTDFYLAILGGVIAYLVSALIQKYVYKKEN